MTQIRIPVNRVEGDLEISARIEDGVVTEAHAIGTMFRGFERLMMGRAPLDSLVLTPRICGICSTSHLLAATLALESISGQTPPQGAIAIRNFALAAEQLQSDLRHGYLMFCTDFSNPAYKGHSLYESAVKRFRPLHGTSTVEAIAETKRVVEMIAILAGQWPHSSFIVPGGIASLPKPSDIRMCRSLLRNFATWYEKRVLGCSLDQFAEIDSGAELNFWLQESLTHFNSDLGLFVRFCQEAGIELLGRGPASFIGYGGYPGCDGDGPALNGGFIRGGEPEPFAVGEVTEHLFASRFSGDTMGAPPLSHRSDPAPPGNPDKYSFIKAPRYQGHAAETGALADALFDKDPLFTDLIAYRGVNAMIRELARLTRPVRQIPLMMAWLDEAERSRDYYQRPAPQQDGCGIGLLQAARGALGHWVEIEGGKIAGYQVITPTAWNASPRDELGQLGPIEQALIGAPVKDPQNPVELGHIIRSFDPCLTCAVHTFDGRGTPTGRSRFLV